VRELRAWRLLWLLPAVSIGLVLGVASAAFIRFPKVTVIESEIGPKKIRTHAATVRDALKEAGVKLGSYDRVTPHLSTPIESGLSITVHRAFNVTLLVDGTVQPRQTAAFTTEEFLHEAGIVVQPDDVTYPGRHGELWPGAKVRVVRMATRVQTVAQSIPFNVTVKSDSTLPQGAYRVVAEGLAGLRVREIRVKTADGVVLEQTVLSDKIARTPRTKVQVVGTLKISASRGDLEGKEVFLMEATGYAPWHGEGVDDITAIGMRAGYGVVAVDPRVVPLRSILYIEGYGKAVAGDTGGAIKGHRIDLGFNTPREAYKWGRRPARVFIISKPTARR
jgi:3D (Asp-Asp-Asp) domain-containing protein